MVEAIRKDGEQVCFGKHRREERRRVEGKRKGRKEGNTKGRERKGREL